MVDGEVKETVDEEGDNANPRYSLSWNLKKEWIVKTDSGWMPWAVGVDRTDFKDDAEILTCTFGSATYGVFFRSRYEGVQVNLETGKWRKLRSCDHDGRMQEGEADTGTLEERKLNLLRQGAGSLDFFEGAPGESMAFVETYTADDVVKAGSQLLMKGSRSKSVLFDVIDFLPRIDNDVFEASPLKCSGGHDLLFRLEMQGEDVGDRSKDYFVGKNVRHAPQEAFFYQQVARLRMQDDQGNMEGVLEFMFEYEGIFTTVKKNEDGEDVKVEMLVLRNLYDGCTRLRMMDIKIGQRTADAGFFGKSEAKALKAGLCDRFTNASREGFRLAGFEGPPESITSRNEMVIQFMTRKKKKDMSKTAERTAYSQMSGADMFAAFLDVHQHPEDPGDEALVSKLAPIELAEITLHEVVHRLTSLVVSCRGVIVPQKWIGSSVALGFDCGNLPSRDALEADVRKLIKVNIFDFGRSELNTEEEHRKRTEQEQKDREKFWKYYVGGLERLNWEAIRTYRHRFGNAASWGTVRVIVYDFDEMSKDDYLGEAELPLVEVIGTPEHTVPLKTRKFFGADRSTLRYSVEKRSFPAGGRLREAWRVKIIRAENLPIGDRSTRSSDPYAVLKSVSEDGSLEFTQRTSVKVQTLKPEWNETFDIPLARESGAECLSKLLDEVTPNLGDALRDCRAEQMFPPEGCRDKEMELAEQSWKTHLAECTTENLTTISSGRLSFKAILSDATKIGCGVFFKRCRKPSRKKKLESSDESDATPMAILARGGSGSRESLRKSSSSPSASSATCSVKSASSAASSAGSKGKGKGAARPPRSASKDSSGKKLCERSCGRPAFGTFPTCCTRCQGPDGPHTRDCAAKAGLLEGEPSREAKSGLPEGEPSREERSTAGPSEVGLSAEEPSSEAACPPGASKAGLSAGEPRSEEACPAGASEAGVSAGEPSRAEARPPGFPPTDTFELPLPAAAPSVVAREDAATDHPDVDQVDVPLRLDGLGDLDVPGERSTPAAGDCAGEPPRMSLRHVRGSQLETNERVMCDV